MAWPVDGGGRVAFHQGNSVGHDLASRPELLARVRHAFNSSRGKGEIKKSNSPKNISCSPSPLHIPGIAPKIDVDCFTTVKYRLAILYDHGSISSTGRLPLACNAALAEKTPPTGADGEMRLTSLNPTCSSIPMQQAGLGNHK